MVIKGEDGFYDWDREFDDVIEVWEQTKKTLMSHIKMMGASVDNSPDAIAKQKATWHINLQQVAFRSNTIERFS